MAAPLPPLPPMPIAHVPAHDGSSATSEALGSLELPDGLPSGDAIEPSSAAAAADHVWREYHAPAAKRRRLRRSPYFRRGVQCAAGTAAILAVISVPAVYRALSLDPVLGNVFILGEGHRRRRRGARGGESLPCMQQATGRPPCCPHL